MRMINGDALEVMKDIEENSVDMILTDLPYGVLNKKNYAWDTVIPYDIMWERINRIIKPNGAVLLFGIEPFSSELRLSNLRDYKYDYYWEKERITNIFQVKKRAGKIIENISVFYKKQPTYHPQMLKYEGSRRSNKVKNGKLGKIVDGGNKKVKEYKDTGFRYPTQLLKFKRDTLKSNLHPTQKPVALLENLIKTFTDEGELVVDFTAGSFSTAIGCLNTNRDFLMIEKDKEIFSTGKTRVQQHLR